MYKFAIACYLCLSLMAAACGQRALTEVQRPANEDAMTIQAPSGTVELRLVSQDATTLRFAFTNNTANSIFLAYSDEESDDEASLFIAYHLLCRSSSSAKYDPYGPEFHHVPALSSFESKRTIIFTVDTPEIKGTCRISVGYYADAAAARLVIEKNAGKLSESEKRFIDESMRSASLEFAVK